MRDSFIFYRSFYEAIKDLPRDIQGEIYTAIMEYSLYGNETENLKPIARSIFVLIKPQIDKNNTRYDNGAKGGRPKLTDQTKTKQEPNYNQTKTKQEPNYNQTETKQEPNYNYNDNDNKETLPMGRVKKTKKKDAALAATLSRKKVFYQSLVPFLEKYPKEMIRNFFDYWSEMNKSCTKMRFEQQPTWELTLRLATWASKDNQFNRNQYDKDNSRNNARERTEEAASIVARLAAEDDARLAAEKTR